MLTVPQFDRLLRNMSSKMTPFLINTWRGMMMASIYIFPSLDKMLTAPCRAGAKAAATRPNRNFSQSWRNFGRSWAGTADIASILTVLNCSPSRLVMIKTSPCKQDDKRLCCLSSGNLTNIQNDCSILHCEQRLE